MLISILLLLLPSSKSLSSSSLEKGERERGGRKERNVYLYPTLPGSRRHRRAFHDGVARSGNFARERVCVFVFVFVFVHFPSQERRARERGREEDGEDGKEGVWRRRLMRFV
jgi:hypothetical protein